MEELRSELDQLIFNSVHFLNHETLELHESSYGLDSHILSFLLILSKIWILNAEGADMLPPAVDWGFRPKNRLSALRSRAAFSSL